MAVKGVGFVGMRTDRFEETLALLRDVVGLPLVRQSADVAAVTLADGTFVELFGPGEIDHAHFTTGPVVGFRVDDFDAVHSAMIDAGVEFLGEVQHLDGSGWRHFRCPDGTVAEIMGPAAPPKP